MGAVIPPKVKVRKNSTGSVSIRPQLNFIEGSNVTITVTDDGTDNEVDVTIAASGSGGGISMGVAQAVRAGYANTFITALS